MTSSPCFGHVLRRVARNIPAEKTPCMQAAVSCTPLLLSNAAAHLAMSCVSRSGGGTSFPLRQSGSLRGATYALLPISLSPLGALRVIECVARDFRSGRRCRGAPLQASSKRRISLVSGRSLYRCLALCNGGGNSLAERCRPPSRIAADILCEGA